MSTSASDRVPRAHPRAFVLVLAVVVVALGGYELALRSLGMTPHVHDDLGLWSLARERAESPDPSLVVFVGASRIQWDVDLDTWAQRTGQTPVQLAMAFTSALPVLEDLAEDPEFAGTVVYSVTPSVEFEAGPPTGERGARHYIEHTRHENFGHRIENRLRKRAQAPFAFRSAHIYVADDIPSLIEKGTWRPNEMTTTLDRNTVADYTMIDRGQRERDVLETLRQRSKPASAAELDTRIRRLAELAAELRQKGGDVVFFRPPSSRSIRAFEASRYPRTAYWDRLAAGVGAKAVHFEDAPKLRAFECADGSHLDVRDTVAFTEALIDALRSGSSP